MTILPDARGRTAHRRRRREGKTLVMFALLLPVLLGVTGLVIDSGMLMAAQRQAQNAADAAALAAAMDLFRGATGATATATANTFMANNGLSGVTLALNAGTSNAVNNPPITGPHAGNAQYAEAYVTKPVTTSFIQVLGVNQNQQVTARAVAGYEPLGSGEGAIVLDPTAIPGLVVTGNNTQLIVNGSVVVNSQGGGVDQFGASVPGQQKAVSTVATPSIIARDLQVVGGVDILDNIRAYDPGFTPPYDPANPDRPLFARSSIAPDPLLSLETPSTSNGVQNVYPNKAGVNQATAQVISIGNGETVTLNPGIYQEISIGGGTVTLNPGIYVLGKGQTGGGSVFSITGGTVTGNNVMIYNTGSNYAADGSTDSGDGSARPPSNQNPVKYGGVSINGGNVTLTPISDTASKFYGVLFYQRRWNTTAASVAGNSSNIKLTGTLYAKWANFQLSGQGKYDAQFVVGSMSISGNAVVTINATGKNFGRANLVFLVE